MTVEALWAAFEYTLATGACPCGCIFDAKRWDYHDDPTTWDEEVKEHLGMGRLDEPVTRLENHWRHYARWGHDGRNPYGGRGHALPTWTARKTAKYLII